MAIVEAPSIHCLNCFVSAGLLFALSILFETCQAGYACKGCEDIATFYVGEGQVTNQPMKRQSKFEDDGTPGSKYRPREESANFGICPDCNSIGRLNKVCLTCEMIG